jgi:hypothetical protein
MRDEENSTKELRGLIEKEVKIVRGITSTFLGLNQAEDEEDKKMIYSHINSLKKVLARTANEISAMLEDMSVTKPLPTSKTATAEDIEGMKPTYSGIDDKRESVHKETKIRYGEDKKEKIKTTRHRVVDVEINELERKVIKRLKKKKKHLIIKKEQEASKYVSLANKFFGKLSRKYSEKEMFATLKRDLIKAHLKFVPTSYISTMLFTAALAAIFGIFLFIFFMYFNVSPSQLAITKAVDSFGIRFLKTFWIIIIAPIITFISIYAYPSAEKSYLGNKINQEMPFATIHMAAISGSMVEPSKMFNILISTGDYPYLQREFTKLINEINVYGYDLVNALRNTAANSPSNKLAELLNGIATTINSGGDLSNFFEKRSQTLLFEYRIEREKYTKTAETFMDIYISLVIAAPMIFMLLLIMMQISGLGISIGTSSITLIMILGVTMMNILFLTFLQLKQPPS